MDIEKLISEVFVRTPLWNQRDKNHHNRFILNKNWDEVAQELNTTRVVARNKWKALRDKFRMTLASIPKPKSGDPAAICIDYKGSWTHFHNLLFIKDQFAPSAQGGNLEVEVEDESEKILEDEETMYNSDSKSSMGLSESKLISREPNVGDFIPIYTTSSSSLSSAAENLGNTTIKKKRPLKIDIGPALLDIETKKLKYFEGPKLEKLVEEDDEDLAFFKSLLPHIKKFSAYDKMTYRMQILQVTQTFIKPTNANAEWCTQTPTNIADNEQIYIKSDQISDLENSS